MTKKIHKIGEIRLHKVTGRPYIYEFHDSSETLTWKPLYQFIIGQSRSQRQVSLDKLGRKVPETKASRIVKLTRMHQEVVLHELRQERKSRRKSKRSKK